MKKDTVIGILLLGVIACGWVFGSTIDGGVRGGVAGIVLSLVSGFIGMIIWALYAYDMSRRMAVDYDEKMAKREHELSLKLAKMVESQKNIDRKCMIVFGEALARKCVVRMISIMATEDNRAHLYEQTEALIHEEVEAARKGSKV